jgi:phosphoribosyl-AMP cyclohydrolase
MIGNADALVAAVKFDSRGLVPVIAQDRATGVVRMLAWANAEALRATVDNGLATFWSRSRNELWEKGKTSGNSMRVHDVRIDCDADAVLYIVDANGPSCHTNATSCFFRAATAAGLAEDDGPLGPPPVVLARLAEVIAGTGQGADRDADALARESADLLVDVLNGLRATGVPLDAVLARVQERLGAFVSDKGRGGP